jgi:heme-degrading monooxygenase HmoA
MAVKILIKRTVPRERAKDLIPLFRQIRSHAIRQPGYISGETLKRLDQPDQFLIISTWQSSEDWEKWLNNKERNELIDKIDGLLGGKTDCEIYHYGFTE